MASNFLLYALVGMINSTLAAYGLALSLGALYLILPAMCMRFGWGLLLVFVTGLLVDASLPIPFGFHAVIFAIAYAAIHGMQRNLSKAGMGQLILLAIGLNLLLMLLETFVLGRPLIGLSDFWLRIGSDMALSTLVLIPLGWWFLSWQRWLLSITGHNAATVQKG
ncbi:MAG: hypothetical protein AAGF10_07035 [Verrucomicrobiota bacterium]